jgi:hypothetical protein
MAQKLKKIWKSIAGYYGKGRPRAPLKQAVQRNAQAAQALDDVVKEMLKL